jgi:hypothetical protein
MKSPTDIYQTNLRESFLAAGFQERSSDEWTLIVSEGITLFASPRSKVHMPTLWAEVSLGIRFEIVEEIYSRAMGNDTLQTNNPSCTLGADLAHILVNRQTSGWSYPNTGAGAKLAGEQMGDRLRVVTSKLRAYASYEELYALVHRRLRGDREDRLGIREHHYIPIVLLMWSEIDLAEQYLSEKLEEINRRPPSPFSVAYTEFCQRLRSQKEKIGALRPYSK